MGIDRTSEEDLEMSEKKFKIGQKVRIIGPSFFGIELGVGKCFVIGDIITRDGKPVYCDTDRGIGWLASSLELAEPESDSTNPSLTGHPIEEVKRTPPEEFQNFEGARLDLSGEFTTIREIKCGRALDGCGLSAEKDERMHRWVGELVWDRPKRERIKMELESIRVVIGILKQREQELQAEYDKLMEAA